MQRFHLGSTLGRSFVLALVCALSSLAGGASATPRDIPPGSKLVYNFNVIGFPLGQSYNGNCGNGHRIFVNRDAKGAEVLIQNSATAEWDIVDCDATADHRAVLATSDLGHLDVYVRILGMPGGNIKICGDTFEDFQNGVTLCLLGTINLTRAGGRSKFKLAPSAMFDASLQDLIWTVDTNREFRIVQFRVYERP